MLENLVIWVSVIVILWQSLLMVIKSDRVNRSGSFLIVTIPCVAWLVGLSVFLISKNVDTMRVAAQVYYIAAAGIVWSTTVFPLYITNNKRRLAFSVLSAVPFVAMALWLVLFPDTMLTRINVGEPNTIDLGMSVYTIYSIYFMSYVIISVAILTRALIKVDSGVERRRLIYILLSYLSSGSFGALFNIILPLLGDYTLIWVGPLGANILAFFVYMSTRRYRLFHMRSLFMRIVALVALVTVEAFVYFILTGIIDHYVDISLFEHVFIVALLTAPTILIAMKVMKSIESRFGSRLLNRELLDQVSNAAIGHINLKQFLGSTVYTLSNYLDHSESVRIDLYIEGRHLWRSHGSAGIGVNNMRTICRNLDLRDSDIIVTEEIDSNKDIYELLKSRGIAAIIKIGGHESEQGYLTIFSARPRLYSDQEIKVLSTISSILTMATRNIQHFEMIQSFNNELEQKVDKATRSLRSANSHLIKLNEAKDEFLSLASHQLRTPLTTIGGYLSMLLDGDFGAMTPEQTKAISDSYSSSKQMAVTISDFLDMSRIQTGRFMLSKETINPVELLRGQIKQLESIAKVHNVKLVSKIDGGLPEIEADRDKITQVMMNFIDNAICYSKPGGVVEISLRKEKGELVFMVRDHGIGVPGKEKKGLFKRFFRATNAKQVRPNGNGVGLYVARRIISAHHGQIIFDSEDNKGSVFGFRLGL